VRSYLKSLDPRLPREVYVLQAGGLLNAFGNGVVLPFLFIYLHNVRGISLGVAGLAAATQSAAALALLAGLTPPARRSPAYALQRLTMNLGAAVGGLTAGLVASVAHPSTFTILFVVNCATFVAYALVLLRVRTPELHPERAGGSWRAVARNRTFLAYTALNAAFMASAISLMIELLPAFGKNVTHVSEREVGAIFALDAVGIVLFQLPVAKLVEGRRRMRGLALMGVVWAASLLAVWAAGAWTTETVAFAVLAGAMLVFAIGECLHGAIHAPLAVDLAPPNLVGRYLALSSLSWQVGWIVGPAAGGFALQHAPLLLWPVAAAVNVGCAAGALTLERRLPDRVRLTPHDVRPEPLVAGSAG